VSTCLTVSIRRPSTATTWAKVLDQTTS